MSRFARGWRSNPPSMKFVSISIINSLLLLLLRIYRKNKNIYQRIQHRRRFQTLISTHFMQHWESNEKNSIFKCVRDKDQIRTALFRCYQMVSILFVSLLISSSSVAFQIIKTKTKKKNTENQPIFSCRLTIGNSLLCIVHWSHRAEMNKEIFWFSSFECWFTFYWRKKKERTITLRREEEEGKNEKR